MFDKENLSLWGVQLLQVGTKIETFYSITNDNVHCKTQFIQDSPKEFVNVEML